MRALRLQYVLAYGITGTVTPYFPLFCQARGFTRQEIGYATAAGSAAMIVMPVVITLLADTKFDPRRLMSIVLGVAALVMVGLAFANGFWPIVILFALFSLSALPMMPVLDGVTFSLERRRREAGLPVVPYHLIRVFGAIGFIIPSLVLFVLLSPLLRKLPLPSGVDGVLNWTNSHLVIVLVCAAAYTVLAALNALRLADPRPPPSAAGGNGGGLAGRRQLPTMEAARLLVSPQLIGFFVATLLGGLAMSSYYSFFPIYVTEHVGIDKSWVGPLVNIGTFGEIFFTLGFAWFVNELGLRWTVTLGMLSIALRMALFALAPNVWVIAAMQLLHGMSTISLLMAPAIVFNEYAEDHFRHSVQGLYTMILGATRTLGAFGAGLLAAWSLTGLFAVAAGVALVAAAVVLVSFHQTTIGREQAPADVAPVPAGEE